MKELTQSQKEIVEVLKEMIADGELTFTYEGMPVIPDQPVKN